MVAPLTVSLKIIFKTFAMKPKHPIVLQNAAAVRYLNFKGEAAVNCTEYEYAGFTDVELYRRFRFLSKQGPGALDEAEVTEVSVFPPSYD